jgi:hypothetical protein
MAKKRGGTATRGKHEDDLQRDDGGAKHSSQKSKKDDPLGDSVQQRRALVITTRVPFAFLCAPALCDPPIRSPLGDSPAAAGAEFWRAGRV